MFIRLYEAGSIPTARDFVVPLGILGGCDILPYLEVWQMNVYC